MYHNNIIDWVIVNNGILQVSFNIIISVILYSLAVVIIVHLSKLPAISSSLRVMLYGALTETLGWGLNRTYWAASWFAELHPSLGSQYGPASAWGWISLIPLVISGLGLVLINRGGKPVLWRHIGIGFAILFSALYGMFNFVSSFIG